MLFSSLQNLTVFLSQLYFSACCFWLYRSFAALDAGQGFFSSFVNSFKGIAQSQVPPNGLNDYFPG